MARRISDLRTVNKAGNTSREYVLLSNIDSNTSTKIALNDVFPTMQSGKTSGAVTEGTAGTTVQDLFVGGGVGSNARNSDKSILIFKGLNVEDTNGALKIRTDSSTSDGSKKNIVIELTQSNIDLNVASNSNSKFLSETGGANGLDLANSAHYTGDLPVDAGGTGASTLTDGGVLIGNGTGAVQALSVLQKGSLLVGTSTGGSTDPAALVVGTDNFVLTADSNAANGVKWAKATLSTLSATADIDLNGNDLKMGGGWINGSDTAGQGLYLDTSSDHVYIGDGTTYATSALNVEGNITLGNNTGNAAQTISLKACTAGATPTLTVAGGASDASLSGGVLALKGGAGDANGNGGNVTIEGGLKAGTGTAGDIVFKTDDTLALTIDENQDANFTGKVSMAADNGLQARGTTLVTQTTSLSTGVTLNSHVGRVRLHSSTLAAAAEAEFTITNSTVTSTSVIMLTVQDNGGSLEANGATSVATVGGAPAAGSFKVRLTNPGSATTTSGGTIHFMVIDTTS